jgi:hypothetical protein
LHYKQIVGENGGINLVARMNHDDHDESMLQHMSDGESDGEDEDEDCVPDGGDDDDIVVDMGPDYEEDEGDDDIEMDENEGDYDDEFEEVEEDERDGEGIEVARIFPNASAVVNEQSLDETGDIFEPDRTAGEISPNEEGDQDEVEEADGREDDEDEDNWLEREDPLFDPQPRSRRLNVPNVMEGGWVIGEEPPPPLHQFRLTLGGSAGERPSLPGMLEMLVGGAVASGTSIIRRGRIGGGGGNDVSNEDLRHISQIMSNILPPGSRWIGGGGAGVTAGGGGVDICSGFGSRRSGGNSRPQPPNLPSTHPLLSVSDSRPGLRRTRLLTRRPNIALGMMGTLIGAFRDPGSFASSFGDR